MPSRYDEKEPLVNPRFKQKNLTKNAKFATMALPAEMIDEQDEQVSYRGARACPSPGAGLNRKRPAVPVHRSARACPSPGIEIRMRADVRIHPLQ